MNNQLEKNNSYLGYTDSKSALQKGKIEKCLSKAFRYGNIIMQRRDAMLWYLRSGKTLSVETESVNGRNKHSYRFNYECDGVKVYIEITKTEYDFCQYLIKNELVSEEAVNTYLTDENRMREVEEEKARQEEETAREEEERQRREKEEFESWLRSAAEMYVGTAKGKLMEKIFIDKLGEFRNPIGAFSLLAVIDNLYDNPMCREELKERLHTDNKASRKTFECVTGLRLPKTNKETKEFIDNLHKSDYCEMLDYQVEADKNKTTEDKTEEFYILEVDQENKTREYKKVLGERIIKKGFGCFIHKLPDGGYAVSSIECGMKLAAGRTKAEAVKNLKRTINNFGDVELRKKIQEVIELYGASPLYNVA